MLVFKNAWAEKENSFNEHSKSFSNSGRVITFTSFLCEHYIKCSDWGKDRDSRKKKGGSMAAGNILKSGTENKRKRKQSRTAAVSRAANSTKAVNMIEKFVFRQREKLV